MADPLIGAKVLIVEDDPFIALALEETLHDFGMIIVGVGRSIDRKSTRLNSSH